MSPSSDEMPVKSGKGKQKKSKLKPLKRLPSKTAGVGKRKPITKLKVNATAKFKSNKMAAAAAVAARTKKKNTSPNEADITTNDKEEATNSNISIGNEDAMS